jgi:hypothetical protein
MNRPAIRMLAVAALCAGVLSAPRAGVAESVFGLNLIGERMDTGDARSAALGGFVQLIDDSLGVLQYNPATTAWAKKVTFCVAGYVTSDKNKSVDAQEKSVSTKIAGFTFAFPLYRKSLSVSLGYRGRYDPDGEFSVQEKTSEGDLYYNRFERSGGLWTVPFALAADFGPRGKLGGFYSLERGTIENRWVIDFQGSSTADAVSTQYREFSGGGWGVGGVVRPVNRVSLALSYEGAVDYDVATDETYTNASANVSYTENVSLPERWTGSAVVRPGGGFTVYAGGSVSDFEKFRGLAFPADRLVREEVVSVGLEYHRSRALLPIRLSARFEQLPYTLPDGEKIQKMAFTLGTGLLFKSRTGKLDLALQFGKTGSVDTNGYEDQFIRFFMSIAGSEEWKRKRESRY